jgi:hypothetical protein
MPDAPLLVMSNQNHRFEEAVEQFLRDREVGKSPDPKHYLETFPELSTLLSDFFAGQDLFDRLAPDMAPPGSFQVRGEE